MKKLQLARFWIFWIIVFAMGVGAIALAAPYNITTVVKEGTSGWLPITFKDQNGALIVPCTVTIDVTDEQTGTVLIAPYASTAFASSPAASIVEPVNNCAHKIVNPGQNTTENRLYTVKFTYLGCTAPTPGTTPTPGQVTSTDYARYVVEDIPSLIVSGTPPNCTVGPAPTPTPRS